MRNKEATIAFRYVSHTIMEDNNEKSRRSRRSILKRLGIAGSTVAVGGTGILFMSRGASAQVAANNLSSDGAVSITSDGGDVTGFALGANTAFDLGWEGFDADVDSVTFALAAQRTQVGTGTDESTARNNLAADSGSTSTSLFTDTPATILSPGRNGNVTYTSGDLATVFPFEIISGGAQGANVTGTIADANIDAASLSLDSDGDTKVNEITFTVTADIAAGTQTVQATESGTMDFVVGNIAGTADTGGTINGTGSGE